MSAVDDDARPPQEQVNALPAWKVILEMVRFRPWLIFIDFVAVVIYRLAWQLAPALIMQAFFNMLTGDSPATFNVWTIVAFLAATWVARVLGGFGFYYADVPIFADMATLLRRNLLRHILRRPGAAPLPDSPGEAVSRFRNDVIEIPLFAIWINDILTGLMIIGVAIVLMVNINPAITLMALAPLVVVGLIANAAMSRIERYRRASRRATGRVTGFLGELFGSVQAVKVATAEADVIGRFHELNDERRKLTLKERLFNEVLDSTYRNTSTLGTGIILILAGKRCLAVNLHASVIWRSSSTCCKSMGDLTSFAGMLAARYKQLGVSVAAHVSGLMAGAPPDALVERTESRPAGRPLPPVVLSGAQSERERLATALRQEPDLPLPGHGERHPGHQPEASQRGTLTVITGRIGARARQPCCGSCWGLLPADSGESRWNGRLVALAG
jgi:ATP-binding cassette, subfamily B, bacterial